MSRTVVWFSCGAASACAAKLAVERFKDVQVVYCDTLASEHYDNICFLLAVEKWIGQPIEILHSADYANIDDVFERTRYMAGIKGARCTVEMKKVPRFNYQQPDDIHIFGLTCDEQKRIRRFVSNNPDLNLHWLLSEEGVTKEACYQMIRDAGIAMPAMYQWFKNNNCIGCVKATSAVYWDKTRTHFPEHFARRAAQSRALGVRLCRYKGVRIFLDELPLLNEDTAPEEDIECGPICLTPEPT